jgi:hypothetical protein
MAEDTQKVISNSKSEAKGYQNPHGFAVAIEKHFY